MKSSEYVIRLSIRLSLWRCHRTATSATSCLVCSNSKKQQRHGDQSRPVRLRGNQVGNPRATDAKHQQNERRYAAQRRANCGEDACCQHSFFVQWHGFLLGVCTSSRYALSTCSSQPSRRERVSSARSRCSATSQSDSWHARSNTVNRSSFNVVICSPPAPAVALAATSKETRYTSGLVPAPTSALLQRLGGRPASFPVCPSRGQTAQFAKRSHQGQ